MYSRNFIGLNEVFHLFISSNFTIMTAYQRHILFSTKSLCECYINSSHPHHISLNSHVTYRKTLLHTRNFTWPKSIKWVTFVRMYFFLAREQCGLELRKPMIFVFRVGTAWKMMLKRLRRFFQCCPEKIFFEFKDIFLYLLKPHGISFGITLVSRVTSFELYVIKLRIY